VPKHDLDSMPAQALKALRKALGFRSATAAADHHGWPASRYRSHESGARTILEEDAKRYAAAYGVDWSNLLHPKGDFVVVEVERACSAESERRYGPASRLRCARTLAGYDSGAEASRSWGLTPSTYAKHERGMNMLSDVAVELYSEIFGVEADWLRRGTLPSGLGVEIDARIHEAIASPVDFLSFRKPRPPADGAQVARLKSLISPGRPAVPFLGLSEYDWDDIQAARGNMEGIERREVWNVPSSFFLGQKLDHDRMFVVAVRNSRDGLVSGERLFVVRHDGGRKGKEYLVYSKDSLRITDWDGSGVTIGTVVGRLRPANPS
jgi:hypothetical protein